MSHPEAGWNEQPRPSVLLAPLLEENVPAIEEVARLGVTSAVLGRDELLFREAKRGSADNVIFKLFDWPWISGNPKLLRRDEQYPADGKPGQEILRRIVRSTRRLC